MEWKVLSGIIIHSPCCNRKYYIVETNVYIKNKNISWKIIYKIQNSNICIWFTCTLYTLNWTFDQPFSIRNQFVSTFFLFLSLLFRSFGLFVRWFSTNSMFNLHVLVGLWNVMTVWYIYIQIVVSAYFLGIRARKYEFYK